jgi:hypothetical protein
MLEHLHRWSFRTDSESSVLWLHGPAGAGKSAIAQSFCQKLEAEGRLGASFFFKRRHPSRGTGNRLFPTIAYQLLLCLPELKQGISQIVEHNPSIIDRALSTQLQKLIIEPCQRSLHSCSLTIVIDGLDECEGQDIQQEIICSIGNAMKTGLIPLRFFVTSRPEPHIHEIFMGMLHEAVNVNQSFKDVQKYLLDEFARIHQKHHATMAMVPEPWPSLKIIIDIRDKSSGYFIYASTVIKFIDNKNFRPTERLAVIMGMAEPHFGMPFAALDQLYTQILSEVPARPQLLKILKVISTRLSVRVRAKVAPSSDGLSVTNIEQLLELEPGDLQLVLRGLHSLFIVPENDNDMISFHHASFRDFLQDPARAGIFYVGGCQHQTDLSCHILKAFSYKYDDPSLNRRSHVAW